MTSIGLITPIPLSIERKKGISGNYEEIATVGQDVTAYTDVLSEPWMYYYRIRAYNGLGSSSYSNEATPLYAGGGGDEGCFIATAAFGSPLERHVQMLRDLRDRYLLTSPIGKASVALYYRLSPPIAGFVEKNEALRASVRVGLYPIAGFRYIAVHFLPVGNIICFLAILAIMGGVIGGFAKGRQTNPNSSFHRLGHGYRLKG